jgi:tripartite-type tricarboxylate transporter receptor subunit TctC
MLRSSVGAIMKNGEFQLHRRGLLLYAVGTLTSIFAIRNARAQSFPTRAVKWIVPYPPGGATDVTARIIAQRLSQRLGQPFIIENKPGAGANLGTEAVVNSAPDGYTLLFVSTANAINASLYKNLRFNFIRDIAPVVALGRLPIVMEVNPSVPAKTAGELIEYAKQNPGKLTYASAGVGTSLHLTGELFKAKAGVDIVHVPYRGSAPALTDLIAGQVHMMFDNISSSLEHIKAGKLRALAVTTTIRFEGLPEVPTLSDTVPLFDASSLYGVGVPRNTPTEVVVVLNREISEALRDPAIKTRLTELAIITSPGSPTEFGQALAAETDKWAGVITALGVSAD